MMRTSCQWNEISLHSTFKCIFCISRPYVITGRRQ
jgi:hypothetical protein